MLLVHNHQQEETADSLGSDGFGVTCSFRVNENDPVTGRFQDVVWNAPVDVDDIRPVFRNFYPPIPAIIDRIPAGTLRRYANVAGEALDTWTYGGGRVVLLGDAAHTHGGAFAAGASLAIDDAYTLYLALQAVFPEADVEDIDTKKDTRLTRALDLYESTRRTHAAKVLAKVHADRAAAQLRKDKKRERAAAGLPAETDEEVEAAFVARFKGRGDPVWLNEHDAEAAFREVLKAKTKEWAGVVMNGTS